MWAGVTARFRTFHQNLHLTDSQVSEGTDHHAGVRTSTNTGLGLAIPKEIVKASSGAVTAMSSEQDGTEFVTTMPVGSVRYAATVET